MFQYVNNNGHPHTIDSAKEYGPTDIGKYGTHIRPDDTHENEHTQGKCFDFTSRRKHDTIKHRVHTSIDPVAR